MLNSIEQTKILNTVYGRLTKRVLCTSNLKRGSFIKSKEDAVKNYRYIRLNSQKLRSFVIFDMDIADCCPIKVCNATGIPQPNLVVLNNQTKHSHWIYILKDPVASSTISSQRPIRYVDNIYKIYCEKLKADKNYSGVLVQNPFYNNKIYEGGWELFFYSKELYSLRSLAKPIQLELYTKKEVRLNDDSQVDYFVGRNCHIFRTLSDWALKNYTKEHVLNWYEKIQLKANGLNNNLAQPLEPLGENELKDIVNSVYRYTEKNSDNIFLKSKEFSKVQRARQKKSCLKRLENRADKQIQVQYLYAQSISFAKIVQITGYSRSTLYRWRQRGYLGKIDTPAEKKRRARDLYIQFVSLPQIAEDVGCSLSTLYRWIKQSFLDSASILEKKRKRARDLYIQFVPLAQIVNDIGCSLSTLNRWIKYGF